MCITKNLMGQLLHTIWQYCEENHSKRKGNKKSKFSSREQNNWRNSIFINKTVKNQNIFCQRDDTKQQFNRVFMIHHTEERKKYFLYKKCC